VLAGEYVYPMQLTQDGLLLCEVESEGGQRLLMLDLDPGS
jgi:hypothetical protein